MNIFVHLVGFKPTTHSLEGCCYYSMSYRCIYLKRKVQDSNLWTLLRIGSLANCWFKPLTQLSNLDNLLIIRVLRTRFELVMVLNHTTLKVLLPKPLVEPSICGRGETRTHLLRRPIQLFVNADQFYRLGLLLSLMWVQKDSNLQCHYDDWVTAS